MTWLHLLRTLTVAGVATAVLVLAGQARAEGADGSSRVEVTEEQLEAARVGAVAPDPEEEEAAASEKAKAVPSPRKVRAASTAPQEGGALKPLIARYASELGLPFELADAVVRLESRYNPGARNGPHMGLTQINAGTAQALGYKGAAEGLLDPETNLRFGLKYLAQAYKLAGGDTCGTILRFQAGHRTTAMTGAARLYCAKVMTILAQAG